MVLQAEPPGNISDCALAAAKFHKTELDVSLGLGAIQIPINIYIIYVFIRNPHAENVLERRRPINWLFVYLAIWDIVFIICEGVWNYYGVRTEPIPEIDWCSGWTLVRRNFQILSECVPAFTTASIAVLRAAAVRQATTNLQLRHATLISIALVCMASLLLGMAAGPGLVLMNCLDVNQSCKSMLSPLYGISVYLHDTIELLVINGTIFVCNLYICYKLLQHEFSMAKALRQRRNHTHHRTIISLAVYTILYTLLTSSTHVHGLFTEDCFREGSSKEFPLMEVLDALFQVGFVGLNPLLLYSTNVELRKSISMLPGQFRARNLVICGSTCAKKEIEEAREGAQIEEAASYM